MLLRMIPYRETTPFTTAAAALLTILHHFKPEIDLERRNEFDIWRKSANLPTRASSIFALASYAFDQGLKPQIIVDKKEFDFPDYRFYRYTKEDIECAAYTSELYLQEAILRKISIIEQKITLNDIHNYLKNGKIILLRLNVKPIRHEKKNISNYIVVYGHENNQFKIVDPAQGDLLITEEIMQEAFDSLTTKKHRYHRMILF